MEKLPEDSFEKLVKLKYELYNGLFLTLPFSFLEKIVMKLPIFAKHCQTSLDKGISPVQIIESFFQDIFKTTNIEKKTSSFSFYPIY